MEVEVLQDYQLSLKYSDGTKGTVDLSRLVGKGVFPLWNDYKTFQNVRIGSTGEFLWGDQVDLCPDSLYLKITHKNPEDVFSQLKGELTHARA